ncbi:PLP-dependent aminotransferase family protein [Streptomyces sp. NPDC050504]|uniref:PLP-dependent aminotransferase family protein n=1 Tax=Streptomyces sp. NPDC050504 TaxID=3365618 RepID=UPI0037B39F21
MEEPFGVEDLHRHLRTYVDHLRADGADEAAVTRTLFQYGRTKGVIHEHIARNLAADEGIDADPEAVVVTVGCQEALYLVLRALRRDERDVLLVTEPAYVGVLGAARLVDLPVWPVREGPQGLDPETLAARVQEARAAGLRPRACYVVPDFANPSGARLTRRTRERLLEVAREQDVLLLEDNPYGLFQAETGPRPPTLKALDTDRRVVYLGSFAKTGFPGARIGYAVADQEVAAEDGTTTLLADELALLKSMLTVNTPPVAQALVAGLLLANDHSLERANEATTAEYAHRMHTLLDGLKRHFPPETGVTWNVPGGGFFAVLTVPFEADEEALRRCAAEHRVLWTPMRYFYEGRGGERQLRLSISAADPAGIEAGLESLRDFVAAKAGERHRPGT